MAYPPPDQGGYPPQGGCPPPQGGYPPPQGGYPPPQGGYPPPQGGYPPPQGGYPPPPSGGPPPKQENKCLRIFLCLIGLSFVAMYMREGKFTTQVWIQLGLCFLPPLCFIHSIWYWCCRKP